MCRLFIYFFGHTIFICVQLWININKPTLFLKPCPRSLPNFCDLLLRTCCFLPFCFCFCYTFFVRMQHAFCFEHVSTNFTQIWFVFQFLFCVFTMKSVHMSRKIGVLTIFETTVFTYTSSALRIGMNCFEMLVKCFIIQ